MGTLYIDRRVAELDFQGGRICIREPGGALRAYPVMGLERVVVIGNTQISTRLFTHLASQGINILLVEGRGARRHAHVSAFLHGDASRRLGQYQLCSNPGRMLRWARLLVHARMTRLLTLYRDAAALRADCHYTLSRAQTLIGQRRHATRKALNMATLRGLEGAAAHAHFEAYQSLFPATLGFTGRNRQPPRDPVNAALSLGYALTHSDAVRVCLITGLDPMLDTLHRPAYGRESLACDLNELARARVERMVWRLFAEKALRKEDFEAHAGGVSLNKSGRHAFWAAYEAQAAVHRHLLRVAAAAFARDCQRVAGRI